MTERTDLPGSRPPEPRRSVRADVLERTTRAWAARVAGATWQQAAEISGYSSASTCRRAVAETFGTLPKIERDDLRHLWRERTELVWRQVVRDMTAGVPGATTAAVRVITAAAQLDGLNEPARFSLTPTDNELGQWVASVIEARGGRELPEEGDIFGDIVDAEIVEDDEPT